MVSALKIAGANEPELLFKSVSQDLDFDDKGKLANLTTLVDGLKTKYPKQFGIEKPNETINGGAGNGKQPEGRAETLGEALKVHYNK